MERYRPAQRRQSGETIEFHAWREVRPGEKPDIKHITELPDGRKIIPVSIYRPIIINLGVISDPLLTIRQQAESSSASDTMITLEPSGVIFDASNAEAFSTRGTPVVSLRIPPFQTQGTEARYTPINRGNNRSPSQKA